MLAVLVHFRTAPRADKAPAAHLSGALPRWATLDGLAASQAEMLSPKWRNSTLESRRSASGSLFPSCIKRDAALPLAKIAEIRKGHAVI
jgi:hypothetical protein